MLDCHRRQPWALDALADLNLDGVLDLIAANGHIDETVRNIRGNVGYAQPPQVFLNNGSARFSDVSSEIGQGFRDPKVARGLAYGDFDRDGDVDILLTTNSGPAYLYRNDQVGGNRSIRFKLRGSNRIEMRLEHAFALRRVDFPRPAW